MTDEALNFIQSEHNAPYSLYLPYTCPNSPFQGPLDRRDHQRQLWKQAAFLQASIERMDTRIGDVMDAIDEQPIIVFASDSFGTKIA